MSASDLPTVERPVHKQALRLRWFVATFEHQVQLMEKETGNSFSTDTSALAEVFAEWLNAFEGQKPAQEEHRQAYVGFAAGLMLRTLIKVNPVSVDRLSRTADQTNPAYFWPEGYLYVAYCLNVRGLVLESDFHTKQGQHNKFKDTQTWWSFRENVLEDPSLAVGFLDLFAGDSPNWYGQGIFNPEFARAQQASLGE
ncbi:MAG: hypothetical protein AB8B63_13705 [Granulosicoccus sp.]